jgi:hypothetical protein
MGVQNKILKLQEQVEILGGALTRALKNLQALETLAKGTLTAFQLHIGEDTWNKLVEELKDVESRKTIEKDVE